MKASQSAITNIPPSTTVANKFIGSTPNKSFGIESEESIHFSSFTRMSPQASKKMKYMDISNIYKKLRYFSNSNSLSSITSTSTSPLSLTYLPKTLVKPKPSLSNSNPITHSTTNSTSHPLSFLVSSTGSCSFRSVTSSSSLSQSLPSSLHCYSCISIVLNHGLFRSFTLSSFDVLSSTPPLPETVVSIEISELKRDIGLDGIRANASLKQVSEIIEIIKLNHSDLESKLNLMNVSLSTASVTEIFCVLNRERVYGLRFFDWIRKSQPQLSSTVDICNFAIDNCGRLDDYEAMICLLKDFNLKRVCLTKKAFGFIPFLGSSEASVMDSIRRVIEVLNEVGGSCRSTGIRALIEMSVGLGFFDIAKFVMEITERMTSHYNVMILELCRRCKFKEVREMLEEMKQLGYDPDSKPYNYLLSSMCKHNMTSESYSVLKQMQEKGCPPDAITFEIFISYSCRLGKLETALEFLNQMAARGIEPRLSTHATLIKCYFRSRHYEEAYNYVVGSGVRFKCSSNTVYSLLASLHQKKGNLIAAQKILIEMIDKGLKPHFSVYIIVLKYLHKSGRGYLASDLKSRFSNLTLQPSIKIG